MSPNGSTNQAIGLAWAWQSLTASPFTIPAMDPSKVYKQVIILLTDGLNTQDRWYGDGMHTSTEVDARQQILCNNIKASGVKIYTVQVNTGGDPTSTLLQNCASSLGQVLPAHQGRPDRHHLPADRHRAVRSEDLPNNESARGHDRSGRALLPARGPRGSLDRPPQQRATMPFVRRLNARRGLLTEINWRPDRTQTPPLPSRQAVLPGGTTSIG